MILDLFAGPGGWSEGLRMLGMSDLGIEWDAAACATRAAAGHLTIRADVAQYPPRVFAGKVTGLIASPPCQEFSSANAKRGGLTTDKGQLVYQVPRWVDALRPEWVACEQVASVEPIWRSFARRLEGWGYRTWVGVLNAADYGVPQTRERAILMASRVGAVSPPTPTHAQRPAVPLFGESAMPWVSMGDALWERPPLLELNTRQKSLKGGRRTEDYKRLSSRPAPTVTTQAGAFWVWERPATTVVGSFCPDVISPPGYRLKVSRQDAPGGVKTTIEERLVLQGFTPDYPLQGSKSKRDEQVGNAIPPPLAAHVLASLTGVSLEERAA